jgi:hypothetical protein
MCTAHWIVVVKTEVKAGCFENPKRLLYGKIPLLA